MKFIFIIVIFFSPISLAQLSADNILQAVLYQIFHPQVLYDADIHTSNSLHHQNV